MPKINEILNRFSKKELQRFAIYISIIFLLLVALLFNKAVFYILFIELGSAFCSNLWYGFWRQGRIFCWNFSNDP